MYENSVQVKLLHMYTTYKKYFLLFYATYQILKNALSNSGRHYGKLRNVRAKTNSSFIKCIVIITLITRMSKIDSFRITIIFGNPPRRQPRLDLNSGLNVLHKCYLYILRFIRSCSIFVSISMSPSHGLYYSI